MSWASLSAGRPQAQRMSQLQVGSKRRLFGSNGGRASRCVAPKLLRTGPSSRRGQMGAMADQKSLAGCRYASIDGCLRDGGGPK